MAHKDKPKRGQRADKNKNTGHNSSHGPKPAKRKKAKK